MVLCLSMNVGSVVHEVVGTLKPLLYAKEFV